MKNVLKKPRHLIDLSSITLETANHIIQISDHPTLPCVFFLFSPTCEICIVASRHLNELANKWAEDILFFGIMPNPTAPLDLPRMVAQVGAMNFPVGYCSAKSIYRAIGLPVPDSFSLPTLILVDADRLAYDTISGTDDVRSALEAGISALIKRQMIM